MGSVFSTFPQHIQDLGEKIQDEKKNCVIEMIINIIKLIFLCFFQKTKCISSSLFPRYASVLKDILIVPKRTFMLFF